jgi:hypothetical protein
MTSLLVVDWRQADFARLYDRWLEMEALRQQIYRRPDSVDRCEAFTAHLRALADDPMHVGAASQVGDEWAGAMIARVAGSSASLALMVLDLHAPYSAAARRGMYQWLKDALRSHGVGTLAVTLNRPLAVEEAMWLALGTQTGHNTYQVTLS